MTDLVVRPLHPGEEHLFLSLSAPATVGMAWAGRDYLETVKAAQYRPEWTWVALRGGEVVGRAAWWGGPADRRPLTLDWLDFGTDIEVGAALLRAAPFIADYCLVLPPGWREDPEVRAAADLRIAAATRAGMELMVERLNYLWTPAAGLPPRPRRLEFRPEPDDEVILDVIRRTHVGTFDAHARAEMARGGVDASARDELEFLHWMPSPRTWWHLAFTGDGRLVGLAVPGRNHARPTIGYIGVVPEQRGHGYGYDLLAEATHILADAGALEIGADTDVGNTPMAAAFARAGYPVVQERVFLRRPS
ncbi:GNAT family N-acetyltransferase [Microtetraspora malaysiensis]|uniref:GNAT family N-acetyltransferase n=1 Tax=Microtetraspora malaysiensis TaxID=161358 RepID=A0ABW6SQJ8_9ACTN